MRPSLIAELTPSEPEFHGLVALMDIQASRTRARVNSTGEPVLLFDQNRAVIELNRAVAVSMAYGPQAGLTLADALDSEPSLARYHLILSVRADLLYKLGRYSEARSEFERAVALTHNTRERDLLLVRAASCETGPANS